jgi:hypothetical protein
LFDSLKLFKLPGLEQRKMSTSHVKYDRHKDELDACINDPERQRVALTWLDQKNTLDSWRHNRMYSLIEPIIRFDSAATWLTVGDGRFGTDAHALIEMGAENVHCSDMSDALLKRILRKTRNL